VVFAVALGGWTWLLLTPNPVPPPVAAVFGFHAWASFFAAKVLHVGAYAVLAALAAVAVRDAGPRAGHLAAGFMLLHGVATEIGQTYVPNRSGSVRDVGLDWIGITAGTLAVWRFRR